MGGASGDGPGVLRRAYRRLPRRVRRAVRAVRDRYRFRRDLAEYRTDERYRREVAGMEDVWGERVAAFESMFGDPTDPENGVLALDDAVELYSLVRAERPTTVVETGVGNGASTLFVLAALAENGAGRLRSVDDPVFLDRDADELAASDAEPVGWKLPADRSPGWMVPPALEDRWELVEGESVAVLPEVLDGGADLFVHDSDHTTTTMLFEFAAAYDALSPGGLIVADDVGASDAFRVFVREQEVAAYGTLTPRVGSVRKPRSDD